MPTEDTSEIGREAMEGVVGTDIVVKGNGPALVQNVTYENMANFQQAMQVQMLNSTSLNSMMHAMAADRLLNTSPQEGSVDAAISQILSKIAGNVPPVTP